ncbi:hypothetical protein F1559_001966 [Cyanidiococcus yangmingshanensis]|uniref:Pantoate--beta-alanine ligase n=1 Tax=Cyanidiococcus yangmingshanensis TaxID=2690220 RepID=A0A7J7IG46_9RHOD|nr:hypothetical protein F1559_001966 [Cyanidiococcus yangmingshanensis]
MQLLRTVAEVRALRKKLDERVNTRQRIAVVMTMGALHEGHESLIRAAKFAGTFVLVTIFVNPLQFAAGEDLERYPRTEPADVARCANLGVEVVFAPLDSNELYPRGIAEQTVVDVPSGRPSHHPRSEGAFRPTFFRGVATVVSKLLHIVHPDDAWFGAKDAQQCCVVRHMVRDLNMPVTIRIGPTYRERSGLAMSSRNQYLTAKERETAAVIYRALCAGRDNWAACCQKRSMHGESACYGDLWQAASTTLSVIQTEPSMHVQYIGLSDADDWQDLGGGYPVEPQRLDLRGDTPLPSTLSTAVMAVAVFVGSTRLIDNIRLSVQIENGRGEMEVPTEALE